ncbi:gas vesicle protein GvpG [Actinophytocola sp.]|uniref:gas vesicle protein GvpG n=1 Tax=Actinophytocola sp. TaxID=1872138 RepID=UPI002ED13ABA
MGLLSTILTFPLAPVRAVMALGRVIQQRVDEEMRNPALARRDLEALEEAHRAGEITDEEQADHQQQILDRMTGSAPSTGTSERT